MHSEYVTVPGAFPFHSFADGRPKRTMNPALYYFPASPPCRSVLLLAQLIGVVFDLKPVDIMQGEQLTAEYLQMNPQHTVPTLADDGLILWESRVIMTYLTDNYATNDTLYPRDLRTRALVDQRLQFDLGTLYARMTEYYFPTMFTSAPTDPAKYERLSAALGFYDEMLRDRVWAAGDAYTVADVTLTVTVSQIEAFGADLQPFARVCDWLQRSRERLAPFGYDDIQLVGIAMLADQFRANLPA